VRRLRSIMHSVNELERMLDKYATASGCVEVQEGFDDKRHNIYSQKNSFNE
jgi:hypothetical protein